MIGVHIKEEAPLSCGSQVMRWLMILFNLLFLTVGIAGIVFSMQVYSGQHQQYVSWCHGCRVASIVFAGCFGFIALVSILGLCALGFRNGCLLCLYVLFLMVFFLFFLALTVALVMFHTGVYESQLSQAWNTAVSDDPDAICQLQLQVTCSGWTNTCTYPVNVATTQCPQCTYSNDQVSLVNSGQNCETVLKSDFKKVYIVALSVAIAGLVLTLLSMFTTCCVRRTYNEITLLHAGNSGEEGIYHPYAGQTQYGAMGKGY